MRFRHWDPSSDGMDGCRTIKALLLRLILGNFLAALYGVVAILTGLVSNIPHFAMDFAKEVWVGLVFHDEQFTPSRVVTGQPTRGAGSRGSL